MKFRVFYRFDYEHVPDCRHLDVKAFDRQDAESLVMLRHARNGQRVHIITAFKIEENYDIIRHKQPR